MKVDGKEYVYVKYEKRSPHLPVAVGDTVTELAEITGVKKNTIFSALCHCKPGYAKVRIDNV